MRAHLQSYATRTSAHGCAYLLLRGSPLPMSRALWSTAIAMSFLTSGYVLWSSIKEMDENPISTSLEYVPVKELPFPSVTIRTERLGYRYPVHFRLFSELGEQFRVDCREHQVYDQDGCVNRTHGLRLYFKPAIKIMLIRMYNNIREFLLRSPTYENSYLKAETCAVESTTYLDQARFARGLYPLLQFLSANPSSSDIFEHVFDTLAENFKLPPDIFFRKLADVFDLSNFTLPHGQVWNCLGRYSLELTLDSKAMGAVLLTTFHDLSGLSLVSFTDLLNSLSSNFGQHYDAKFVEEHNKIKKHVNHCSRMPVSNWTYYPWFIIEYLEWKGSSGLPSSVEGCNFENGGCKGGDHCCTLRNHVQHNYGDVLSAINLFQQPLGPWPRYLREQAYVEGMVACAGAQGRYEEVPTEEFRLSLPALAHCQFELPGSYCQDMYETFTTNEFGHAFNSANFFEIYRESAIMDIFCNEVVQLKNYNACTSAQRDIAKVDNGMDKGLQLFMHSTNEYTKSFGDQRLAIHSTKSIADMHGNNVQIIPGFYHYIEVTPRVITADLSLLEKEQSVRNCHQEGIDANPLRLFKHYSRENCQVECKIRSAKARCGCVSFKFPREDGDTICARADADCFIDFYYSSHAHVDCEHCRDECTRVDYQYKVRTVPFNNICLLYLGYKELIWRFVGLHGYLSLMQKDLENIDLDGAVKNKCDSYARKRIAIVYVYHGPPKAIKIVRRPRVTFLQQVANLGGMVALFTGMSILSIFELFMWLAEIPWALKWTIIHEKFFKTRGHQVMPKITSK